MRKFRFVVIPDATKKELANSESEVLFLAFALTECTVKVDSQSVKYLRAVHRTALELAIHNRFGMEIGGFWLTTDQIAQLRALSEYYPLKEAPFVAQAIEAYLAAQLEGVERKLLACVDVGI